MGTADTKQIKQRLQNIDAYEFEHMVADLWEQQGWATEVKQASNDMGVDVVAERHDGLVDQDLVIQAKRYSDSTVVGRPDIQQYNSLKQQEGADGVVVVTTSQFASTAEEYADEMGVKLVDGDDLVNILREQDAMDILDEYAPVVDDVGIDPAPSSGSESTGTDELGVEVAGEESVDLPEQLQDDETRLKIAAGTAVLGVIVYLNPIGTSFPVGIPATLLVLLAGVLYLKPEELWDTVTPTREVYREFSDGGVVALDGGTIQYEPPGDGKAREFDEENDTTARQRAAVYGALHNYLNGLTETQAGTIPTEVTNEGDRVIAAYRFAVHGESPELIASEMQLSQQVVVDHLRSVVD